jgi:hypothetical protein
MNLLELDWSEIDALREIHCMHKECNRSFEIEEGEMCREAFKAGWLITSYSRKVYCPKHRLN